MRRAIAVLGALGTLLAAGAASADERSQRRIDALRGLVMGAPVSSLDLRTDDSELPPEVFSHFQCLEEPWWEESRAALRLRMLRAVRDASLRYGIDRGLILSVIRHESAFDPRARSHAGAMGLMQLMPRTAREQGVSCPDDPRENVLAGTRYLRGLYDRFGNWPHAVAAYNAGPTRVERRRFPKETRRYVRRVLRTWQPLRYPNVELAR